MVKGNGNYSPVGSLLKLIVMLIAGFCVAGRSGRVHAMLWICPNNKLF
jgi:hypothetical protein